MSISDDVERVVAKGIMKRSEVLARAVVESFHAQVGKRPMRPVDTKFVFTSRSQEPMDLNAPTLMESNGVAIKKCALEERGIVEVVCTAEDFAFDNPIYIVNPPLLVEDPNGTIERVVGEDELGNPITQRYREDPTQAMIDILADLKNEGGA